MGKNKLTWVELAYFLYSNASESGLYGFFRVDLTKKVTFRVQEGREVGYFDSGSKIHF